MKPNEFARLRIGMMLILTAALPGCGGCGATVAGKVTVGTKPVASGIVVFTTPGNVPYVALIKADGAYKLTNLPAGEMKISVVNSMIPPGTRPIKNPDVRPIMSGPPPIPDRYKDPNNGLKFTVRPGTQLHDINLSP